MTRINIFRKEDIVFWWRRQKSWMRCVKRGDIGNVRKVDDACWLAYISRPSKARLVVYVELALIGAVWGTASCCYADADLNGRGMVNPISILCFCARVVCVNGGGLAFSVSLFEIQSVPVATSLPVVTAISFSIHCGLLSPPMWLAETANGANNFVLKYLDLMV